MTLRKYRSVLVNDEGLRLTVILPSENRPPWRQPYDVADDYANSHAEHGPKGPWRVVETEPSA